MSQYFCQGLIHRLAVAGQLRRVEDHHVEPLAVRDHVAQPGEEVGLDVADRPRC